MWTASKTEKGMKPHRDGNYFVNVAYLNDGEVVENVVYRTNVIRPDWPDVHMRERLALLNLPQDLASIPLGDPLPEPVDPGPTQEQIDFAAFEVLCKDYRFKKAQFEGGLKGTTQEDLDAAAAAIKTAYIDSPGYNALVVGLF